MVWYGTVRFIKKLQLKLLRSTTEDMLIFVSIPTVIEKVNVRYCTVQICLIIYVPVFGTIIYYTTDTFLRYDTRNSSEGGNFPQAASVKLFTDIHTLVITILLNINLHTYKHIKLHTYLYEFIFLLRYRIVVKKNKFFSVFHSIVV